LRDVGNTTNSAFAQQSKKLTGERPSPKHPEGSTIRSNWQLFSEARPSEQDHSKYARTEYGKTENKSAMLISSV